MLYSAKPSRSSFKNVQSHVSTPTGMCVVFSNEKIPSKRGLQGPKGTGLHLLLDQREKVHVSTSSSLLRLVGSDKSEQNAARFCVCVCVFVMSMGDDYC